MCDRAYSFVIIIIIIIIIITLILVAAAVNILIDRNTGGKCMENIF